MAIEADRMRNLSLREEDRQPEMTVVRNEFERGENSPFQALIKEIFQAAYVAHPYHHSTIGWRSDIEKVSIEKLREFYDTFYWPNNATRLDHRRLRARRGAARWSKKYYGAISALAETDSASLHRGAGTNRPAPRHRSSGRDNSASSDSVTRFPPRRTRITPPMTSRARS